MHYIYPLCRFTVLKKVLKRDDLLYYPISKSVNFNQAPKRNGLGSAYHAVVHGFETPGKKHQIIEKVVSVAPRQSSTNLRVSIQAICHSEAAQNCRPLHLWKRICHSEAALNCRSLYLWENIKSHTICSRRSSAKPKTTGIFIQIICFLSKLMSLKSEQIEN